MGTVNETERNMELEVGTRVTWRSAAGNCRGVITKIMLKPAASGKIAPWILVDRFITKDDSVKSSVMLCGSDSNLKMMQVEIG